MLRTYSRKGSKRSSRAATTNNTREISPSRSPSPDPYRQRKRQKIQVEVVAPLPSTLVRAQARDDEDSRDSQRLSATRAGDLSECKRVIICMHANYHLCARSAQVLGLLDSYTLPRRAKPIPQPFCINVPIVVANSV